MLVSETLSACSPDIHIGPEFKKIGNPKICAAQQRRSTALCRNHGSGVRIPNLD
jgi:hypothetical protein